MRNALAIAVQLSQLLLFSGMQGSNRIFDVYEYINHDDIKKGFETLNNLAEREGFEPSVPLLAAHTISSRAPSASRTSLHLQKHFSLTFQYIQPVSLFGGEGGIRTHDPVFDRIPLFESGAFSRSATSPKLTGLKLPASSCCE